MPVRESLGRILRVARRRQCTPCGQSCGRVCPPVHRRAERRPRRRRGHRGQPRTARSVRTKGRGRGGRQGMAETTLDLATVWDQIRERLATSLSPQQNAMLNLTRPVGLFEDTAVLEAPNEFTQTVLESRMRRVLAEALSQRFGRDIRVAVQVEDAPSSAAGEPADDEPVRRPWGAVDAT